jgi:hypothetical protein
MGFNKRFVDKEMIESFLNDKISLDDIFNGDAIIMLDDDASFVYKLYTKKINVDEIKLKISEYYGRKTTKTTVG